MTEIYQKHDGQLGYFYTNFFYTKVLELFTNLLKFRKHFEKYRSKFVFLTKNSTRTKFSFFEISIMFTYSQISVKVVYLHENFL